jgi:hypothetical protein
MKEKITEIALRIKELRELSDIKDADMVNFPDISLETYQEYEEVKKKFLLASFLR